MVWAFGVQRVSQVPHERKVEGPFETAIKSSSENSRPLSARRLCFIRLAALYRKRALSGPGSFQTSVLFAFGRGSQEAARTAWRHPSSCPLFREALRMTVFTSAPKSNTAAET
jgi:hypothetical protein